MPAVGPRIQMGVRALDAQRRYICRGQRAALKRCLAAPQAISITSLQGVPQERPVRCSAAPEGGALMACWTHETMGVYLPRPWGRPTVGHGGWWLRHGSRGRGVLHPLWAPRRSCGHCHCHGEHRRRVRIRPEDVPRRLLAEPPRVARPAESKLGAERCSSQETGAQHQTTTSSPPVWLRLCCPSGCEAAEPRAQQ